MVCVVAFIILFILVLFVPVIRIFNKKMADSIWSLFKKSWGCVGRRLTLRKCDTNFKDDIKNLMLRKLVLKKPTWVKPLSIGIEIAAVLITLTFIWSVVEVAKAGLSLVAFGTCNVAEPESCILGAESCAVGDEAKLNWFEEWGEIFAAMPNRFKRWGTNDYLPGWLDDSYNAIDIFDPGCVVCRESFLKQQEEGFFEKYNVALLPYTIMHGDQPQFANSEITVKYLSVVNLSVVNRNAAWQILTKLFTETDEKLGVDYQTAFNNYYSEAEAEALLKKWVGEIGLDAETVYNSVHSDRVNYSVDDVRYIVDQKIRTRKIPTMIYDGKIHFGSY